MSTEQNIVWKHVNLKERKKTYTVVVNHAVTKHQRVSRYRLLTIKGDQSKHSGHQGSAMTVWAECPSRAQAIVCAILLKRWLIVYVFADTFCACFFVYSCKLFLPSHQTKQSSEDILSRILRRLFFFLLKTHIGIGFRVVAFRWFLKRENRRLLR